MAYDIIYYEYLNSLRVIYPSIEVGEVPERFRSLVNKAQKLEQPGIISYLAGIILLRPL